MKLDTMSLAFPEQYLQAALLVSLLSVWVLVGLFVYLNRYTKREYFTVWTAAWLFYALWLTLSLRFSDTGASSVLFMLKQCCVAVSAVFLLWGSLRFLNLPVRQGLFGLFMLFLLVWTYVSPQFLSSTLQMELPVFMLLGMGSLFAGTCFYRLRKRMPFVGAGMLSLGFSLWGVYLASYPVSQQYKDLYSAGFFVAAVLQLFIAVSMIVLVLEEVRFRADQTREEITTVRSEKDELQAKFLTSEEQCRALYDQVRLKDGVQRAYDELRRTQQMVVQQERLRALGEMASGVAHDVNNALSPVVAYSELLLNILPDLPEKPRKYLQVIKQSGQDISQIVARMREFYRRRSDAEKLVAVNVNEIIDEVIVLARPRWRDLSQRHGTTIQIECKLEPGLPALLSDPTELREALVNLVFNAADALPQGGTITFVTRVVEPEGAGSADRRLQVEVRDDGMGMDENTRARCLEPFFSTKAQRGGTGLGLAMVYGMMQRHEGLIEIDSASGKGTVVRLVFPLRDAIPLPGTEPARPAAAPRALRVLCIDDEIKIRTLLHECLTSFKHQVTVASSGQEGLELLRAANRRQEPFDVVITDLGMSHMDGRQVAKAVKQETPDTPVIMMTGWGAMMKQDGECDPQVDVLIGKPPRIGELNEWLHRFASANRSKEAGALCAG